MKFLALFCIVLLLSSLPASLTQAAQETTQPQATETSGNEITQKSQTTDDSKATPVEPTPTEGLEAGAESVPEKEKAPAATSSEETPKETSEKTESDKKEGTETKAPVETKSNEQESTEKKNNEEAQPSATETEGATPVLSTNVTSTPTNTTSTPTEPQDDTEPKTAAAPPSTTEGTKNKDNGEKPAEGAVVEESTEHEGVKEAFSIIGKIIGLVLTLFVVAVVGCVYNYRYQMDKYKIPPFTPPTFCPDFIFPRSNRNRGTSYGYSEVEVGEYRAPHFNQL